MQINFRNAAGALAATAVAVVLAACGSGGGGSGATTGASATGTNPSSTTVASQSIGAITAFGSVFVNGHEFNTDKASVVDDDTGATTAGTADLDIGEVVRVIPASDSTESAPVASEIHVDPLARGFVDVNNVSVGTLTVMGQTVQITASTAYVDRRACVVAASSPCSAINSQSGLTATSGTTPGDYVTVHGYLYSTGTAAQIVATLISVQDYVTPTATTSGSPFKLEGQITSVSGSSIVIGGETVDLSAATCSADEVTAACSTIAAVGKTVAAFGFTAPASSTFAPTVARLVDLLPQTAGVQVEIEGKVSSVIGTSFVVQGITIDGSGLPATQIPAVGDTVELVGTVAANGQDITATAILRDRAAAPARLVFAGPLTSVSAGTAAGTYDVTVLGQTATVDSNTMIVDRTVRPRPTFNITNFQTYIQGLSALPYVTLAVQTTSTGGLQANAFEIVEAPSDNFVKITGPADGAVIVGNPSSVTVHGIEVLFDATSVRDTASIAKGTNILAAGTLSAAGAIDTTVTGGIFRSRGSDRGEDLGF
jgi:Domain of unknown function (DUF5666)